MQTSNAPDIEGVRSERPIDVGPDWDGVGRIHNAPDRDGHLDQETKVINLEHAIDLSAWIAPETGKYEIRRPGLKAKEIHLSKGQALWEALLLNDEAEENDKLG